MNGTAVPVDAPAGRPRNWTTLSGLRSLSLTAWERGQLLRELIEPSGVFPRRRPLKRPTAAELLSDYAAARAWAGELVSSARYYSLETVDVGRSTVGTNQLPAAAVFATADDEIAFVGRSRDAARFRELADLLSGVDPALRAWALKRPHKLVELGDGAATAGRIAVWLRDHRPGIYVRQLSLPGVHTKFIEQHRNVIDEMSDMLTASESESGTAERLSSEPLGPEDFPAGPEAVLGGVIPNTPAARFASRHGFLHPPELVRFRLLDPGIPLLGDVRDMTVTADAFAALRLPVDTVIVTENLVNFLALPERPRTLALFGRGYGFSALREAFWLQNQEVLYWGDLDTHGFRILDQLRAVHPHVTSILMDEATLLAHRDVWGREPSPSRAALTRLTAGEREVYEALGNDTYGPAVRLEQEQIRWDWVTARLSSAAPGC